MATWYVIDTKTNEIVNAVEADRKPTAVLALMTEAEHLRLDQHPPQFMLRRYRYWNERP